MTSTTDQTSAPPRLRFSLTPEPARLLRARERIRDYLTAHCSDQATVNDIVLAIEEACTNAIRHSGSTKDIDVQLHFSGDELRVSIKDEGRGFDVESFDSHQLPDPLLDHGRGLYLISCLCDELRLHRGGGLEVRMVKRDALASAGGLAFDRALVVDRGRAAGERLRVMLDEIDEGFVALDWEYRCTHVNAAASRLLGHPSGELLGGAPLELWPELVGGELERAARQAMELGRSSIVEYETDDGEWLEARFYPTTVGLSVYFRNIDQRKHKELERDELFEALRANQAMLERSQELAHLGSWELDLQSGRLTWSDEVYRIFGLQPQEFGATYEAFLERMHPDDRQAVDAAYSGSLREERDTYEIEHRVVRKDSGEIRLVHERCDHRRDAAGTIVRSVGMVHDITERRRADDALSESEERYHLLFESMVDGYAYCRMLHEEGRPADFVYLAVNAAFEQLTGLHDVVGRKVSEAIPDIQRDNPELFEIYGRVAAGGAPESFETYLPALETWFSVSAYRPLPDHFAAVFENITARKEAEANQALLTEVLQVLNRPGSLRSVIGDALRAIQRTAGFDAVGVRLREGDDYPYFEHNGFTDEFLQQENFLCALDDAGAVVCDAVGRALLECTCGLVVSGRTDQGMSCFTPGGSFWTNRSTDLLALPLEDDPRTNPRNRCIHTGFQSVGLFPVRAGEEIVGLLQLNDHREGCFTPELVLFYESLAQNIGLALQRASAEEALRDSEARLRMASHGGVVGLYEWNATGDTPYWGNPEAYQLFGLDPDGPVTFERWLACVHPADRERLAHGMGALRQLNVTTDLPRVERDEYRILQPDGRVQWLEAVNTLDRDGADIVIRGAVRDVTERKEVEQELLDIARLNEGLASIEALVHSSLNSDRIIQAALSEGARILGAETGTLDTWEEKRERFRVAYVHNFPPDDVGLLEPDASLGLQALRSGETLAIHDTVSDPRVAGDLIDPWRIRSTICARVMVQGEPFGVVYYNYHSKVHGFTRPEIDFVSRLAASLSSALENAARYQKQRGIALILQENLLHRPPAVAGLELGRVSRAAQTLDLVGGDVSDAFVLDDGQVAILIGDVAGKGVEAAGLTETVRSTVRAFASVDPSPAFALEKTNELLLRRDPDGPHVTAFYCLLDSRTGHLAYASAGHPAPIHLGPHFCRPLAVTFGPPLGSFGHSYEGSHTTLTLDDYLVLYTDGVTEARRAGEMYGERRLVEAVAHLRGWSAQEMAEGLVGDVGGYADKLVDDIEVVALRLA